MFEVAVAKSFIKKIGGKKKICILLFCEAIAIFFVHIFSINELYGFFLSEDELGYWGNAAFLVGKDWGNTVSYCSYYSVGYSFFLMLIMVLPIKALTMYRIAIVANALFMVVAFFISYYIFVCHFPQKSKVLISITCAAMALYSSYIAQSSVAWSECYLILFTWLILLQSYLICKKVTTIRILIYAVELVYIYAIHQRTIPVLILGVFLVILMGMHKRATGHQLMVMIISVTVMLCLLTILKDYLKSEIYSSGIISNTYSSIVKGIKLSNLIIPAIRAAAGQIYYLWAASFGIIPFGIGVTIVTCIKKWREQNTVCFFNFFVLLVFFGLLGVSSIFVRLGTNRIDYLIYGRYIECIVGYFIIIGLLTITDYVKLRKSWIIFAASSVGFVGLALLLLNKIQSWDVPLVDYQGVCAAGTFWFYLLKEFSVLQLCAVVLLVEVLIFVLTRLLFEKREIFIAEIIFIIVFWITAGSTVIKQQICIYQNANNRELMVKSDLWNYIEECADNAVFLSNTRYNIRGSLQLYLGKVPLLVISDMEELEYLPDALIIDNDDSNIDNAILDEYNFVCCVSGRNVYLLNEISLDNLGEQILEMSVCYNHIAREESGYVVFGPYIRLEPGDYEITFQMNNNANRGDILGMMDVVSDVEHVICSTSWDGVSQSVAMRFHVEERINSVEFRYFKNAGNDTIPLKVILRTIND